MAASEAGKLALADDTIASSSAEQRLKTHVDLHGELHQRGGKQEPVPSLTLLLSGPPRFKHEEAYEAEQASGSAGRARAWARKGPTARLPEHEERHEGTPPDEHEAGHGGVPLAEREEGQRCEARLDAWVVG